MTLICRMANVNVTKIVMCHQITGGLNEKTVSDSELTKYRGVQSSLRIEGMI